MSPTERLIDAAQDLVKFIQATGGYFDDVGHVGRDRLGHLADRLIAAIDEVER